jgi:branched-chain amino acid transport system ATP-binding protein
MTEALLELAGVSKHFGGVYALNGVDLAVERGEVHALIGPNGAGKTTLIHHISGAMRSDAGAIRFDGADLAHVSMHARVRLGLARSYQITNVFARLTVLDNVALAVQARSGSSFSFWRPAAREAALADEAQAVLARVGLAGSAQRLAGGLSHGEQRALEVGIALATQPRLLLLDEPLAGMGPEESERMVELLDHLGREVTLLLVEHDMDAVFRLADRVSVLVAGKVIATGLPDEVRNDAEVRRAYLGDEA